MPRTGRPKGTGGAPQTMTKKGVWAARKMALVYAEEAIDKLVEVMRDENTDRNVQRQAANDLLNRAFGTPPSYQTVEKIVTDETGSPISTGAISTAGTRDLEQLAATLARFIEAERATIDVTPAMPEGYPDA